jgi:hypothetical protein
LGASQSSIRKEIKNENFDFKQPIFGCSLQVLGLNLCQNALFADHSKPFAVLNGATQGIANPLEVATECSSQKCPTLAKTRQL